ncbi:MAG: 2-oxo acid dehydrogenase subunit E2 [Vicinamibacterales bacterium]
MPTDFTLPELGEQIAGGDVLRVMVKAGDTLAKDQAVLELETDKATIEVPSSVAGVIAAIKVKAGEKVKVGQVILTVEDGTAAGAPIPASASTPVKASAPVSAPASTKAEPPVPAASKQKEDDDTRPITASASALSGKVVDPNRSARPAAGSASSALPPAPASPSVRRMARELGVDINTVSGSGPDGRISVDDVKTHTKRLVTAATAGVPSVGAVGEALPDFSRWGDVERKEMKGVRRKTAERLSMAWATIPLVTQQEYADITALEEVRRKYQKQAEAAGGLLTVTAVAVKILATALKQFPQFNSSVDLAANEIIYKKFVNVGVAVDTDRGLIVPVIRNADQKNLMQIAIELTQLSEKARSRKISLDEMQGGCISVSNLGGIGGSFFTPLVNPPEVAILGISRGKIQPVWDKDTNSFVPRQLLPLSLSYDHRVIDGADGIRFLRWVVEAFEQPFVLALQG